jgi:hypothetical protein
MIFQPEPPDYQSLSDFTAAWLAHMGWGKSLSENDVVYHEAQALNRWLSYVQRCRACARCNYLAKREAAK